MLTITTYEHTHTQQQHKHKQMCTPEWVGVNTNGRAQAMHKWGRTGRGRRNWETNKWWCMDKWGGTACNNKSKGRYTCTPLLPWSYHINWCVHRLVCRSLTTNANASSAMEGQRGVIQELLTDLGIGIRQRARELHHWFYVYYMYYMLIHLFYPLLAV